MVFSLPARFRYMGNGPILVATLLTAALIQLCWPIIHGTELYPDPVASRAALNNIYKTRDFIAVGMGATLIPAVSLLLAGLCRWVAGEDEAKIESLNTLLLASLIPAAWRAAVACSIPSGEFPPLPWVAVLPVIAVIGIVGMLRFRATLTGDQPLTIGSAMMVGTVLAVFAGLAIPVSLSRVIPVTTSRLMGKAAIFPAIASGLVCAVMLFNWIKSTSAQMFEHRALLTLKILQLPIPLLLFYLIPVAIADPLHRFPNPCPKLLIAVLGLGCLASWFFIWRRFRKAATGDTLFAGLSQSMAPMSIAAILVFIWSRSSQMPEAARDYFHFSEEALPWQQLWDFGKRPYVDFVPIHGLMSLMRGMFNQVFFQNTAGTFHSADTLLMGLSCVALALAASTLVGSLGAMFLLLAPTPDSDRMYFLAPAMFLIAAPGMLKRPARSLCVWLILCLLMVAYNPTVGPAFTLGTALLAIWLFYRACRQTPIGATAILLGTVGIVALLGLYPPIRQIAMAFKQFVTDNAWTNEIAHAISFEQGYNRQRITTGPTSTAFSFEMARLGWVGICMLSVWFLWREMHKPRGQRSGPLLALTICTTPVMLLTVPWVLGRIQPGELGDSGSLTHVGLFLILPLLIMLAVSRRAMVPALLGVAALVGYFYPTSPTAIDMPILTARAVELRAPRPGAVVVDATNLGLSHIGTVVLPDHDFLSELNTIRQVTSDLLKPGETFLDLTNQGALYYYLNLPMPVRYAAFVSANSRLQSGELAQLHEHPVPAVLIDPSGWIDEAPPSLRCYEIYRDYVTRFPAVDLKGWVFLVDPSKYSPLPTLGSEDQLKLLDQAFCKANLHRLPISWGQSWSHMKGEFTHVTSINPLEISFKHSLETQSDGSLKPTGPAAYFEYGMPKEITAGTDADFVRIKLQIDLNDPDGVELALADKPSEGPTGAEPAMACFWASPPLGYAPPISFKAASGELLLPLGAYPRWLLCHHPTTFRLDLQNQESAKSLKVMEIEFLKFTPR